jgi:menaquinol-cytochrome c reductase iron-sulfur subunit
LNRANPDSDRRRFLNGLTGLLLLVIALLVAIPALIYLRAPLRRKRVEEAPAPDFLDAGPLSALKVGEWHLLTAEGVRQDAWQKTQVTRHAVYVRRHGPGEQEVTVLAPICPHLGCPINWNGDRNEFLCPCHGGVFNSAGQTNAGPPPRRLDALEWQVRDGRLWVRWQDYKLGVAEQVPVSV